jgi:dTDP-4-dehydrorhamnose reductase
MQLPPPPVPPKLLITGASGLLGWHLLQAATAHWQVYGTYKTRPSQVAGATLLPVDLLPVDLCNYAELKQLFSEVRPNAVIHAAAQSNPNLCQQDPQASYAINVAASINLAELCAAANIPCVFTSTDLVFDGRQAPYCEIDPVNPVNRYGEQKVNAEQEMSRRHGSLTIARLPLMFGIAPNAQSFLQPCLNTLQSGNTLSLFVDEFRTPVSAHAAAQGLLLLLEVGFPGLVHLGGRERLSRYQFGQRLIEVLQLPATQLRACQQAEISMPAPRPADVALDSRLAYRLGYDPATIVVELEQLLLPQRRLTH